MAIKKGIYKVLNSQGTYDTIYLQTDASQVIESDSKRFVSLTEKTTWNNKADSGHKHKSSDITDATDANTANMIVKRDVNGDFSARNLKGNASTATALQTARKINGIAFDGTADITITAAPTTHTHTSAQISDATNVNTANKIVKRDANGNFAAGTITATLSGNASTATKLQTARTINGVAFDGSSNITITAAPTSHNHDDLYKRKTEDYRITPKFLSEGQDLNELYISGHYVSNSDGNSNTIVNRPPGDKGFTLEVRTVYGSENASGRTIQTAITRESNTIYVRSKPENGSWTSWIKQWNSSNLGFGTGAEQMARGNHTHNYLPLSGGNLTGELTINSNKVYHAGNKPTASEIGAAASSHNHNTSNITALTGYAKATTASALKTSDSLNTALGKLEKSLDGKKDASWIPTWSDVSGKPSTFNPASHTHTSQDVSKMTGYVKGTTTSAITATDTLNAAISKIEVALDGKSNTHSHPYRPNTWVPTWSDVTNKPTFATVATSGSYNDLTNKPTLVTINDSSTTATAQTWSAKKINTSLSGKANSSHTHSTSDITGLGSAATLNAGTSANQVLKLDANGKVPVSTLPSIAINETFTAANQAAALKLTVQVGDIVIVTADSKTYICVDSSKTVFDDKFKALSSGTDTITKAEVESLLNSKVDKVSGKGLSTNDFTAAYKTKLDGIEANANKYVHPNDANTRHVTDSEKSNWNSKAAGNHNHDSAYLKLTGGTVSGALKVLGTAAYESFKVRGIQGVSTDGATNDALYLNYNNTNPVYINGTNKVYHQGFKPTASEIGAAASNHTHDNYVVKSSGGNITIHADNDANTTTEYVYLKAGHNVLQVTSSGGGTTVTQGANKLTFNGNIVYHAGRKPTAAEIGAAATSHGNHVPATQTADARKFLRNDNTWQTLPSASTSATGIVQLTDSTSSTSTTTAATANAVKLVYDLANGKASSSHGHNNLVSRGKVTMEAGTTRPAVTGLSMTEAYNNDYPTTYGNVMTMRGGGDGQLLIGWSSTSGAHAPAYIRSKRNTTDAAWSGWAQIYTTAHKPSLTDLGISTLTRGNYLTGSNYNGTGATTWAVDATTTNTANKVVARDGTGDVHCRLVRSEYANQTTISGAMAFRTNNTDNNYIRFCSDTAAIRTFLSTYAKSETYTRTEMDNRYRQKTDLVFTDTISIITPAS